MPSTPMKNLLYRAALPFLAPSPRGRMTTRQSGEQLHTLPQYERLLIRHRVQGASLLLWDGQRTAHVDTSTTDPAHTVTLDTLFRVASITKTATALATLHCIGEGLFGLDTPIAELLRETEFRPQLQRITVRHLLCHTSGLADTPSLDRALRDGDAFTSVLAQPGVIAGEPGQAMRYSNLGFGLLGCVLEQATGLPVPQVLQQRLFDPLGMRATLDASTLDEKQIMPISRVLPYRKGQDVTITSLGRKPLNEADPLRHFGHTAGAMYTDAPSLARMLQLIHNRGMHEGQQLIPAALMEEMTRQQASTPTRSYGLGLVLLQRDFISPHRLLGHQGFAYGCVDGAFVEEGTGRMVVFLNGGASEARNGKLGLVNQDVLAWALTKEMPSWT